jgi:import receptor subunit TOM70
MSSPSTVQDTAVLPSQSVWDRISAWASEHKAVVYTVAGVTLVATAAGVYYYVSSAPKKDGGAEEDSSTSKRKAKKDRRKIRMEVEEKLTDQSKNRMDSAGKVSSSADNQSAAMKSSQPTVEEDELPEITEEYATSLNEAVCQDCDLLVAEGLISIL